VNIIPINKIALIDTITHFNFRLITYLGHDDIKPHILDNYLTNSLASLFILCQLCENNSLNLDICPIIFPIPSLT